jgi:hypothetical protein
MSVPNNCKLTIWNEGEMLEPIASKHEPTFIPVVLPPLGQFTVAL